LTAEISKINMGVKMCFQVVVSNDYPEHVPRKADKNKWNLLGGSGLARTVWRQIRKVFESC